MLTPAMIRQHGNAEDEMPARFTSPALLLRGEGVALLALSALLYTLREGNWLLFALLLFVPDLAMASYLLGNRTGAAVYNLAHTYAVPAALAAAGVLAGNALAVSLALIWCAHIGLDRLLGYGLKYPSAFKDTHLGRV